MNDCHSEMNLFRVCSSSDEYPDIEFYFNDDITMLDSLAFSDWHGHFEESDDELQNFNNASSVAKKLVSQKICLVEELGEKGKYLGSRLQKPNGIPDVISDKTLSFRRIYFDREPEVEPIDYSKYMYEGYLLLSRSSQERLDRINAISQDKSKTLEERIKLIDALTEEK